MELIVDLKGVRRVHHVDLASYGHSGVSAYWCEWDHPQVNDTRNLTDIIDVHARTWNWSKFIKPGDTCIDIGAHSGDTVVPMAVCAYGGPLNKGTVLAVEPNTKVLPVLEVNLALNAGIGHYKLVNKAVTETPMAEVEIADHGNFDCNGGIIDSSYSNELQSHLNQIVGSTIKVEGLPLGTICSQNLSPEQLAKISFIKTDCEGYDKQILRSSFDLIDRYRPALFVEWFNYFKEEDSEDLFAAISEIGYRAYHPMTAQLLTPANKIDDVVLLHKSIDLASRF
ncbi:hypothetical protein DMC25_17350 [Caulobacter sp. D4A]|uniref:FkbM family methyltransferase n=1 Tax=unclassified Caulobacter TaxID=2648921 RepID=UPI000D7338A1|nr:MULTISPECIES: FkbM family methyltransferase [unclassified Caulobacter]PXA83961.1 hypothetical protein DMC25_17350 [Caulobacter sp. D4A]PXA87302.1 hypothetical protein DMC18_21065 [Caulobacter sp. D5]